MSSRRQTLEQRRAEQAYTDVKQIDDARNTSLQKGYSSLARKAPAMIQSNGLGQTLAFLRAKAGHKQQGEHWLLYHHLSTWITGQMPPKQSSDNLLEWVITQDSQVYRQATTEALAYLNWLKRWAEAVLPDGEGES